MSGILLSSTAQNAPAPSAEPESRPQVSILTCLYRSRPFLDEFVARCDAVLRSLAIESFEYVFVDDGSPDDSADWVRALCARRPGIRLVELSRNFGHHLAAIAGLANTRGEHVFLIDCDLEVGPEFLAELWGKMMVGGADVVYGYQEERKGGWVERWGGRLFWSLFNRLSDTLVPPSVVTERLMSRRYVDALLAMGDRNVFLAGMMYWAGFVQLGMPVRKQQRAGASSYTLRRRLSLLMHAVTSFSAKPLYASLWIGGLSLIFAFVNAAFVVLRKIIYPDSTMLGFPTMVALLTGFFGVMMLGLGVVGVYVARIFVQTQQRPLYIVKNIERSNVGPERHAD